MKHSSPLETEVKLRIPALAPLRPLLLALGFAERTSAQAEESVLWDRDGGLRAQGSALRLRRYAGEARLTWKGPVVPDPILKIRPEEETSVADPEAMEAILRGLGFAPVLRMAKTREVWEREELEACLDETPFGCFLELEGDPQAIRAAMEHLCLDASRVEPRSYPALFEAHGLGQV
ncbi:MAG TPA: class IV adenylate cyclase [Holophagaceae bacterium]|nr:class IV adenylate cyclase [Holophagaceae bacterium]